MIHVRNTAKTLIEKFAYGFRGIRFVQRELCYGDMHKLEDDESSLTEAKKWDEDYSLLILQADIPYLEDSDNQYVVGASFDEDKFLDDLYDYLTVAFGPGVSIDHNPHTHEWEIQRTDVVAEPARPEPSRTDVYQVIDGERDYQDRVGVGLNGREDGRRKSVGDYLSIIRHLSTQADAAHYGHTVDDELPMHIIRKIAATAVQAMEVHGAFPRENPEA